MPPTTGTFALLSDLPAAIPAGTIIQFSGTTAPSGYLICPVAATAISRTTYAVLFAAIGTTWGAGDGSTTFNMPYFPADYTPIQANNNVGTSSVGQVISHSHTYTTKGATAVQSGSSTPCWYLEATANTGVTGGTANLAAGIRVLNCVKY
jgi:phage-related tail fiber protein